MANITQYPTEWSPETLAKLKNALQSDPTAFDRYNALFDAPIDITPVRAVAKETGNITEVRLHEPGEIVTMEDGRRYEVQDNGQWLRVS